MERIDGTPHVMASHHDEKVMVPAEVIKRRFERSVLGLHALMPPEEKKGDFAASHEKIIPYPSGANTSFQDMTPMPYRMTPASLSDHNKRNESAPPVNACYSTTASEIGRLSLEPSDLAMRYYPMDNRFTTKFFLGNNEPKKGVNTGLNSAMDRSFVHHTMDQGWAGNRKLTDHNISSLSYARARAREGR